MTHEDSSIGRSPEGEPQDPLRELVLRGMKLGFLYETISPRPATSMNGLNATLGSVIPEEGSFRAYNIVIGGITRTGRASLSHEDQCEYIESKDDTKGMGQRIREVRDTEEAIPLLGALLDDLAKLFNDTESTSA